MGMPGLKRFRRRGAASAGMFLAAVAVMALLGPSAAAAGSYDFLAKWGSQGSEPGQFESPAGITIDSRGNAYVADSFNNRI